MINPPQFMRTFYYLQTPVFFICFSKCHHYTDQLIREHELVFIPVTVILVPFPSPANLWLFLHQLRMKVAYRGIASKQLLYRTYHLFAPGKVSKNIVPGGKP